MSTFKDHFSGHATSYAQARPLYPEALYDWLAAQCVARDRAWDAGCGNGQAAVALAAHFGAVYATDPSAQQIANAQPHPRVAYAVEPAEQCGLPAASVDLVSVAQALHWFCFDDFFAEAARVLKPGGVLAAFSYGLMRVSPAVDAVVHAFEFDVVGPYWPPERRHVDAAYRTIEFPFAPIAAPVFTMTHDWSQELVLGYLATWSAVQRYRKATGDDPLPALAARLAEAWGDATTRTVEWPLTLVVRRR